MKRWAMALFFVGCSHSTGIAPSLQSSAPDSGFVSSSPGRLVFLGHLPIFDHRDQFHPSCTSGTNEDIDREGSSQQHSPWKPPLPSRIVWSDKILRFFTVAQIAMQIRGPLTTKTQLE